MSYLEHSAGMTGHPEIAEMRERLERTASSGKAIVLEGLILLAGVYAAISPWGVHFSGQTEIAVNNLIVGITIGLIGLAAAPQWDQALLSDPAPDRDVSPTTGRPHGHVGPQW
jgi:hypothetical protein